MAAGVNLEFKAMWLLALECEIQNIKVRVV